MTAPTAIYVEMPFGNAILDTDGGEILDTFSRTVLDLDFVDVQADVLAVAPIEIMQGSRNGEPLDRVGDPGTIKLVLDNSQWNTGGVAGYYSPDSTNVRPGFGLGTLVRVGLEWDGSDEWLAQGRIIEISPEPGLLGTKHVYVTAGDWLELASRTPMPRIEVLENVTDDQVLQQVVDALALDAPFETDFETGAYTYNHALTDVIDEETMIVSVLQSIAQNGLGRIFITGGASSGEILKYVDLYTLLDIDTPVASFVDAFTDAQARRLSRRRVKRVVASGQSFTVNAGATLYTLPGEIIISAGQSVEISGFYRDADANSSATIPAKNVITPVVGTDVNFSSVSGSGSDLNASLSIDAFEIGARSFRAVVRNGHGSTNGYLWKFEVRGDALLPYNTVDYTAADNTINERDATTLQYDLNYHDEYATIAEIAEALLGWYSVEASDFPYIEFVPSLSDDDFQKFVDAKPGTLISNTESVTGISYNFVVVGRHVQIHNGGQYIVCRLYVTPALQIESGLFFTLDVLGLDDLDGENTILAFGS